jgi:predicted flap endonuclease-1-like 5' DNA nuclease
LPVLLQAAQVLGKNYKANDLKMVEGVGSRIDELLHKADIITWPQLAATDTTKLKNILDAEGEQVSLHDPSTWTQQAKLAVSGLWQELIELQDSLQGRRI